MDTGNPRQLPEWARRFWSNTVSAYLSTISRLVFGILGFRLLWQHLSAADFGLWSVMWGCLGVGVILDLGIGLTIQRATSAVQRDPDHLGRLAGAAMSMLFVFGSCLALTITLMTPQILALLQADPASEVHRQTLIRFAWVLAPLLALNIPGEILAGLQRHAFVQAVQVLSGPAVYLVLWTGCEHGWGIDCLAPLALSVQVLPGLCAYAAAERLIPGLRLWPRCGCFRALRGELRFSGAAYLAAVSRMVASMAEPILVANLFGLPAAALYQAGLKVGELLGLALRQLHTVLPAAIARLHAERDTNGLARLMIGTSRLTTMLSLPVLTLVLLHRDELIRLLTKQPADPLTHAIAGWCLASAWIANTIGSTTRNLLLLGGQHRLAAGTALAHAALVVALPLLCARSSGPLTVAIAIVVANLLPTLAVSVPAALRLTGLRLSTFLGAHLGDLALSIVLLVPPVVLLMWWPAPANCPLPMLALRCLLVLLPMTLCQRRLRAMLVG